MTHKLSKAKMILKEGGYTLVLTNGENILSDTKRGVAPLISLLNSNISLSCYSAADKVVGAGAAFLYVLLNVQEIYASVISERAKEILLSHGVTLDYDTLVPFISNRAGDGVCPIESAVADARDAETALVLIRERLKELAEKK